MFLICRLRYPDCFRIRDQVVGLFQFSNIQGLSLSLLNVLINYFFLRFFLKMSRQISYTQIFKKFEI